MRGTSGRLTLGIGGVAAPLTAFLLGAATAASIALRFAGGGDVEDVIRRRLDQEDGGNDDGEYVSSVSFAVLVMFLILAVLTVGFDLAKDYALEETGSHMRPIVHALFGELTVLGFLSAFTFIVNKTEGFRFVAYAFVRGGVDEEVMELEEEIYEAFELVHFSLFFVMVVFVVQVMEDVREGMKTAEEWMDIDRDCRDPEFVGRLLAEKREEDAKGAAGGGTAPRRFWDRVSPYVLFLPQFRRMTSERRNDKLLFYALRHEFILERSVEPPFKPADPRVRVEDNFNFGRYLAICLGEKMAHVVEIDALTWVCLAAFGSIMFCTLLVVGGNLLVSSSP